MWLELGFFPPLFDLALLYGKLSNAGKRQEGLTSQG
jgi:hypothetical protein